MITLRFVLPSRALVILLAMAAPFTKSPAQVALSAGTPSEHNFNVDSDRLFPAEVYPWINDNTIPGWHASANGKPAERYRATKGSRSVNPPVWLLRNDGSDASLGLFRGLHRSGLEFSGMIGICFVNNTGKPVTELMIGYTGEQWVHNTGGADRLDFQYSPDATSLTTGKWTDFDALDFAAPLKASTVFTPVNGNAAANKTKVAATLSGLSLAPGATLWLRWTDFNAEGEDQALAIDDLSITAK